MRSFQLIFLVLVSQSLFAQNTATSSVKTDPLKNDTLSEVIITASRVSEKIMQSAISIEKVSSSTLLSSGSKSFFDALENVKGVQMITPSAGFRVINTRGFANPTNVRFVQLVDGTDNQAPHIGGPIGNSLGPNDLDIQSVEIIPGSASALYGLNALNGLANFLTKDPFIFPGFSFNQKTGINMVQKYSGNIFSESSFRYAVPVSKKFAFKITGTFTKGNDFIANNTADLSPNINSTTNVSEINPAYDAVNGYGNESANRRTLNLAGKSFVVARTGYFEKDVADYDLQNIKADGALYYRITPSTEISYTYRFALLNNIYQRSNRFRLEDYFLGQQALSLKNSMFQLRAYQTAENTGKSYNLRSMAENLDRSFKNDDTWFSDYSKGFNEALNAGNDMAGSLGIARLYADNGRLQPGITAFINKLQELQNINNWDIGAALRVKSKLYHIEGQISISSALFADFFKKTKTTVLIGGDHRTYSITPDGNYFINPVDGAGDKNLLYSKTGGFIQADKRLFSDKLKLGFTLRADKNDYFRPNFTPRITAVLSPDNNHSIRTSYQKGFRYPSVFEAFSNVNSGGVKRVGGLPIMSAGIFESSYLRTSIDAFQAAVIKDINNGISKNEAINKNQLLLKRNTYSYLKTEELRSYELGYRGILLKKKLTMDLDFYYNRYAAFIGQVEVNIPKTQTPDSLAFYLNDKKLQDRYRMWTNSNTTVYNYGGSVGLKYKLMRGYNLSGNLSFAALDKKTANDGLEDGFNTPKWMTNFSFGNNSFFKSLGFNVLSRWQSSYYWQSFLVNGNVPSFLTVDAQLNYLFPRKPVTIKLGSSNITNNRYYSFLGGPQIGAYYYTSITFNAK